MSRHLISVIVALWMTATSVASNAQVKITYIANEGVMLEGGGAKMLMDPFFKIGFGLYQVPQISDIPTFIASHPELNKANAILVSHRHADHIDPAFVAAYMAANPDTKLVSSAQGTDSVVNQFGIERARVTNLLPKMNEEIVSAKVGGLGLKAAWMRHGNQRNFGVVNLCFITEIGGRKIMHLGDSEINPESFQHVDFSAEGIDLLLAPYWWLVSEYGGPEIIKKQIKPKKVIAFHLSNDYNKAKEDIVKNFPDVIFFDTPFSTFSVY